MTKKKSNLGLELLFALAAYVGIYYLTGYVFFTALLLCVPVAFVTARRGLWAGLFLLAAGAGVTYLIFDPYALLIGGAMSFFLLPGLMIYKKRRAWETLIAACAAATLAAALIIGYIYFFKADRDILSFLMNGLTESVRTDDFFAEVMYGALSVTELSSTMPAIETATVEVMREFVLSENALLTAKTLLSQLLPQLTMSYIIYSGVSGFFIARSVAKKTGKEVAQVPAFSQLAVPKQHGVYLAILFALSFVPMIFSISNLLMPAQMLNALCSFVFALQGISLLVYVIGLRLGNKFAQVAMALLIYVFLQDLVILVGVADVFMNLRNKVFVPRV